jgi:hypothetical protein
MTFGTPEHVDTIRTRADLVRFLNELHADYIKDPDSWENHTLERFLEALAAFTNDMDGFYLNRDESVPIVPEWKTFAQMLMGAKFQE